MPRVADVDAPDGHIIGCDIQYIPFSSTVDDRLVTAKQHQRLRYHDRTLQDRPADHDRITRCRPVDGRLQ